MIMILMRARWTSHMPFITTAVFFFALIQLGNCQAGDRHEDAKASGSNANNEQNPIVKPNIFGPPYQRPRIKWELLDFRDWHSSPSRRAIKSVCLIEFKGCLNPLAHNPPIKEKIDSDDPLVLQRTQRGLCCGSRNVLSDLAPMAVAMDNVAWGILRISASDGEFVVFIYSKGRGFALDFVGDGCSSFYSWTLARVIDDLYVRKTGKHLDKEMLDSLTGESMIPSAEKIYAKECEYLQKIVEYTAIIEKDPKAIETYIARADALRNVGRHDAAIADYTCVIELSPNDATHWLQRGNAYYVKADYQRAIADIAKALELDPKNLAALNLRWQVYDSIGDKVNADAALKALSVPLEYETEDEDAAKAPVGDKGKSKK